MNNTELIGCVQHDCAKCKEQADTIAALKVEVVHLKASEADMQRTINLMCDAIPGYEWCGTAELDIAKGFAERDTLRAQLAALQHPAPGVVP